MRFVLYRLLSDKCMAQKLKVLLQAPRSFRIRSLSAAKDVFSSTPLCSAKLTSRTSGAFLSSNKPNCSATYKVTTSLRDQDGRKASSAST